jgi:hypothetical protein
MDLRLFGLGLISAFAFTVFDILSSKHIKKHRISIILGRILIFATPIYFIFDELMTGSFSIIQYVLPFIVIKYLAGLIIRLRKQN